VKIGNGVKIQNNVNIYGAVIGDEVMIGPNTSFTNDLYPRAFIWNEKKRSKPIVVGRGASIGANSTVIGGVKIGEYALVGAGSVVTKDVPAHALVYGNPARVKGFVCRKAEKMIKESEAGDWVWLKCPECREKVKVEKSVFEARECY
jgi:acetyltransferase-like isoleucine patch superfamily enzyme